MNSTPDDEKTRAMNIAMPSVSALLAMKLVLMISRVPAAKTAPPVPDKPREEAY